ncbi:MAG: hypothetical protein U1E67_12910 [Hyphomicrobiales bacterium]
MQSVDASLGAATTSYPLDGRITDIAAGTQILVDAGPSATPRLHVASVVKTEDLSTTLSGIDQLTGDTVTHLQLRETIRGRPTVIARRGTHATYARSGTGSVLSSTYRVRRGAGPIGT